MRRRAAPIAVLVALGAFAARAQDATPPLDLARLRRALDRDPERAVEELNGLVRAARGDERARLLLLRAQGLRKLREDALALEDLKAVLSEPRPLELEEEAARSVRELRAIDARLEATSPALPGEAQVVLRGTTKKPVAVEWAIYRADAKRLRRALPGHAGGLDTLLRRPPPETLARTDAWRETLEPGAFERRVPASALRAPGVYVVAATIADAPFRATVVVAEHALVARLLADETLLRSVNARTGEPCPASLDLAGAPVRALGDVDGDGVLSLRGEAARVGTATLVAWTDDSLATVALVESDRPARAPTPLELIPVEPLVRPGEIVRALALSPVPSSVHPVSLRDPRGRALVAADVTVDADGLGEVALPVPPVSPGGAFALESPGGSARFLVAARRGRAFEVDLVGVPETLAPGEALVAHVRASLAPGVPLAGGRARWAIRPRASALVLASGDGELDADGELKVAALHEQLVPARGGEVVVEATVADAAGREERVAAPLVVRASVLSLALVEEPPLAARTGTGLGLAVRVLGPDGRPAGGAALVASATRFTTAAPGAPFFAKELTLGADGEADLWIPLEKPGRVVVGVAARRAPGEAPATLTRTLLVGDATWAGERTPGAVRVALDRTESRAGERVLVLAALPCERGAALVTKERDEVRARSLVTFDRGALAVELPIDATDAPGVTISVSLVTSGAALEGRAPLAVSPGEPLAAHLALDRTRFAPDEALALAARVVTPARRQPRRVETPSDAALRFLVRDGRLARLISSGGDDDALVDDALVDAARVLEPARPHAIFARTTGGALALETALPRGTAGPLELVLVAASGGRRARDARPLVVEAPLRASVSLPPALTDQDEGSVLATVENPLDVPQTVKLEWTVRGLVVRGDPRVEGAPLSTGHDPEPSTTWIALPPRGRARVAWLAKATAPGLAALDLVALGDGTRAQASSECPVRPRGAPRESARAGLLDASGRVALEASAGEATRPESVRAEILLAASIEAAARDALAALPSLPGTPEGSVARLADLALVASPTTAPSSSLALGRGSVGPLLALVAMQRDDGSWPASATAAALEALARHVPAVELAGLTGLSSATLAAPAIDAARARGVAAAERELDPASARERVDLLAALAAADPERARSLRARAPRPEELDPEGRARLADFLLAVGERVPAQAVARALEREATLPLAARARLVHLLARLGVERARLEPHVHALLAARRGATWEDDVHATRLAALALLACPPAPPARELVVLGSKGELARRRSSLPELPSVRIVLDPRAVARGEKLELHAGAGAPWSLRVTWSKLTQGLRPLERGIAVRRTVARTDAPYDAGRGVPPGTELRVTVSLETHARGPIVLDEPLPGGARFLGVTTPGASWEKSPGLLRIRLPAGGGFARSITYALRAERAGDFTAPPTRARVEGLGDVEGESDEWRLRVRD